MGSSNTGGGAAASGGGDAKAEPSASDATSFSEGEKVLAFHGPRIYEAKVQKVETGKKEWRYFVHYTGWNKNWDEWVGADRLLKYTDENVQKQHALEQQKAGEKIVKAGRSSHSKAKALSGPRGKKRRGQSGTEEKEMRSVEKIVPVQLPLTLRKQLVDDWEFVTQLGKLVKLPRSPNVDDILKKYLDYRTKKDGMVAESVGEILKGIRCYFDKSLPAMLLYKKERHQFHEAIKDSTSPSTIYGAEHLLRLFVKLPELLAYVNMEEEALTKLHQNLLDFLKPLPPVPNMELSNHVVEKIVDKFVTWINAVLSIGHNIAIESNKKLFFKVVLTLYFVSYFGSFLAFSTLIYIGFLLSMTLPYLYTKYQDPIDKKLRLARVLLGKEVIFSHPGGSTSKEKKT